MKNYESPKLETLILNVQDVITTSPDPSVPGEGVTPGTPGTPSTPNATPWG